MSTESISEGEKSIRYSSRVICHLTERFAQMGYGMARRLSNIPSKSGTAFGHLASVLPAQAPVIIDVGANVGQFATIAFRLRPDARILSIDPVPENVDACRRAFGDRQDYQIVQAAVGEKSGPDVTFHVNPTAPQSSSLLPSSDVAATNFRSLGAATTDIQVPFRSIDDLLRQAGHTAPIDLLKLDVEGYEVPALRGATETMARSKAIVVETQVKPMNKGSGLFDEVCYLARENGFHFHAVIDDIRGLYGELLMLDLLFVK